MIKKMATYKNTKSKRTIRKALVRAEYLLGQIECSEKRDQAMKSIKKAYLILDK